MVVDMGGNMTSYKVCKATSKHSGKIITSLTHIVETDEKPKDYSIENDRYYFDYYFFDTEEHAKQFIQEQRK